MTFSATTAIAHPHPFTKLGTQITHRVIDGNIQEKNILNVISTMT